MPPKKLIVIGGGPGGYAAALESARRKVSVTLVEKDDIGGTCLNRGCIPSKFLLTKAKQRSDALHLADSGIQFRLGKIRMRALLDQKTTVVTALRQRMEQALKSSPVERLLGKAQFLSPQRVEIISPQATQTREADAVILATGSSPVMPKIFPPHPAILNSATIFNLTYLPSRLVVVGGGYIGCELACAFQGLGSKVTLIEKEKRLLPTQPEFEAAATVLHRSFEKRGMAVWMRTEVQGVTAMGDQHLRLACSNGEQLEATAILLAVGRRPHVEDLDMDKAGLRLEKNRLRVNGFMQTSVPTIYAIGDVVSPLPLAHVATREAEVAVAHFLGEERPFSYSAIPRCVYTWPEAAAVGWTEEEAQKAGHATRIGRYHFAASSKAMVEGETDGLWMIVSDAKTRKILGGQIVGPHATELIHLLALSLRAGLTVQDVAETVFAHPTLAEGFQEATKRSLTAVQRPRSDVQGHD